MVYLSGKVCLVTGATRGIGRGIALQLVTHGATCYITGRSKQGLTQVEEEVKSRRLTGKLVAVQCDHACDESVSELFKQIEADNNGRLDLLVNNAFSGIKYGTDNYTVYYWDQHASESWDKLNNVGLRSHYICAVYAARLMVPHRKGLIINISSFGGKCFLGFASYGIGKAGNDRMAKDCAYELSKFNVAFLSLWPGLVKTDLMSAAHEDILQKDEPSDVDVLMKAYYHKGESPEHTGKAIVHLLNDQNVMSRSGQIELTTDLASEFRFKDVDGSTPIPQRSIKLLLLLGGAPKLASFIPAWLKLPKSLYFWLLEVAWPPLSNRVPSKYE